MRDIFRIAVLGLALAGCDQARAPSAEQAPNLVAPAQEGAPARALQPVDDATTRATGPVSITVAVRLPDAASADHGEDANVETLTLRGAGGVELDAALVGAVQPSTQVRGQTLRALMGLPVEASQTLIYRVTRAAGASLCGDAPATHLVVWEPESAGDLAYKLLPMRGGAPASADAQACPALAYRHAP